MIFDFTWLQLPECLRPWYLVVLCFGLGWCLVHESLVCWRSRQRDLEGVNKSVSLVRGSPVLALPTLPCSSIAQSLGPRYVPNVKRLSPDGCERLYEPYEAYEPAVSPSPFLSVSLFAPIHLWSLSPLYPSISPPVSSPPGGNSFRGTGGGRAGSERVYQAAHYRHLLSHQCSQTDPLLSYPHTQMESDVATFLGASLLDRLNTHVPSLLCDCPPSPRVCDNDRRFPLRGDLLTLRLRSKMKGSTAPSHSL
jgi:hypothetical protein